METAESIRKPAHLESDLSEIWDESAKDFRLGIGATGLEAVCRLIQRARLASKRLTDEGIVVEDAKGNPIPHPALAIEKQVQSELRQWIIKFRVHSDG